MKKQIIYIWGWEAKENYKDFNDYLKKIEFNPYKEKKEKWSNLLEKDLWEDFEVIRILLPNKYFADYNQRKIMFEKVFPYLKEDAIFIWYSLGWTFLVKYFDEEIVNFSFSKLFLVAPAFKDSKKEVLWTFNFDKKLEKIKKYSKKITIFHSKDDPIVCFDDFLDFKKNIPKAKFIEFENKWHFLIPEFPEIIKEIKKKS